MQNMIWIYKLISYYCYRIDFIRSAAKKTSLEAFTIKYNKKIQSTLAGRSTAQNMFSNDSRKREHAWKRCF